MACSRQTVNKSSSLWYTRFKEGIIPAPKVVNYWFKKQLFTSNWTHTGIPTSLCMVLRHNKLCLALQSSYKSFYLWKIYLIIATTILKDARDIIKLYKIRPDYTQDVGNHTKQVCTPQKGTTLRVYTVLPNVIRTIYKISINDSWKRQRHANTIW